MKYVISTIVLAFVPLCCAIAAEATDVDENVRDTFNVLIKTLDAKEQEKIILDRLPSNSSIAKALVSYSLSEDYQNRGKHHFSIRSVFNVLKLDPVEEISFRLNKESNAVNRGYLVLLFNGSFDRRTYDVLVRSLEDKEIAQNPHPLREGDLKRVCDLAFEVLAHMTRYRIEPTYDVVGRERNVKLFREYLRNNAALIAEKFPERPK